jgi:hypothetical protein
VTTALVALAGGALGVGCPVFIKSVHRNRSLYQQKTGLSQWRHTDEVTAGDGRVVGSATGNADFGVIGPLVEDVVRAAVGMGIGASDEGRGHNR